MTKHYSTRNTNSAEFEKSRSSSRVLNLQVLFSSLGVYEWTSRNLWTLSKICAKHRVCIHCLEEKAYDSHQSLKSHKCDRSQNSVPVISHTKKVFPMAFFLFVFFNHASSLHCANWASLCKWVQMRGPTVCSETLGLITNDIPFHSHMRPTLVWILSYKIIGQIYWIHFKPPMISEIPPWWGIICVLFCFVLKNKLCMKNAQIYRTPSFLTTTSGFIMLSGYKRRKGYMTSITITLNILLMMSLYAPNR